MRTSRLPHWTKFRQPDRGREIAERGENGWLEMAWRVVQWIAFEAQPHRPPRVSPSRGFATAKEGAGFFSLILKRVLHVHMGPCMFTHESNSFGTLI